MPLYEADLDKLAVEVKSVSKKRVAKKDAEPKKRVRVSKKKVSETKSCDDSKTITDESVAPTKPEPAPEPVVPEPIAIAEPVAEPTPTPVAPVADKPIKEKKQRVPRQKKDPTVAPAWFAKYVEGVKKEQASMKSEKVPAKKVKEEAQEAATKSWNHGLTRNRVQNEVDGHMSRMYSMIFSK
jgi:hypothetical protein